MKTRRFDPNARMDRTPALQAGDVPLKKQVVTLDVTQGDPGLFKGGGSALARARHVSDPTAATPALLQVAQKPLGQLPASEGIKLGAFTAPDSKGAAALRAVFNSLPSPAVRGDIRLLEHNVEAWLALWQILKHPEGGIDATYYILERDIFGLSFLGGLLKAAKSGEHVRLGIDATADSLGRKGFTRTFRGQDYLQELVSTGHADVRVFRRMRQKLKQALETSSTLFAFLANNHDKLVRNRWFAQSGGRNISKNYFVDPADRKDVYRDTDVLVHGEAASAEVGKALGREFEAQGLNFKIYNDWFGNLRHRDAEMLGCYHMMDAWLNARKPLPSVMTGAQKQRLRQDKDFREQMAKQLFEIALTGARAEGAKEPWYFQRQSLMKRARELAGYAELFGSAKGFEIDRGLFKDVELKVLDRESAATGKVDEITLGLAAIARATQDHLYLQNPYVVLTSDARANFKAANNNGAEIYLLTNSPDSTDSVLTQAFFLEDWPRLMAELPNLRIFALTGDQKLHAKASEAGETLGVASTYNLDLLSQAVNSELAIVANSPALATNIRQSFERDLANPALKVVEYKILRDAEGRPVIRDGEPVVQFGPENHMSKWKKVQFKVLRWLVRQARKLPVLGKIQRPALPPPEQWAKDPAKALPRG